MSPNYFFFGGGTGILNVGGGDAESLVFTGARDGLGRAGFFLSINFSSFNIYIREKEIATLLSLQCIPFNYFFFGGTGIVLSVGGTELSSCFFSGIFDGLGEVGFFLLSIYFTSFDI
jgi:hypothetical protein